MSEATMTATEIRDVSRRLTRERAQIAARLREGQMTDHEWIALRGKEEGMLYASGVFLEALVAKESGTAPPSMPKPRKRSRRARPGARRTRTP